MSDKVWSPVLDYNMIQSRLDIFSSINGFELEYSKTKAELFGKCNQCGQSTKRSFAQFVRNKIVEGRLSNITKQLDPRTIIRYGNNIYRASDII